MRCTSALRKPENMLQTLNKPADQLTVCVALVPHQDRAVRRQFDRRLVQIEPEAIGEDNGVTLGDCRYQVGGSDSGYRGQEVRYPGHDRARRAMARKCTIDDAVEISAE